jgi:hypothetical protein
VYQYVGELTALLVAARQKLCLIVASNEISLLLCTAPSVFGCFIISARCSDAGTVIVKVKVIL